MHEFRFKNNNLYCEKIKVATIAKKVATPFYLYSLRTILDHYRKLEDAFRRVTPLICYSMKANSNLAICKALVNAGSGLDIVSGGELFIAQKVGAVPERIVFAGVGKTTSEIEMALRAGILLFNVESPSELETINRLAGRLGRIQEVCLRLNPNIQAHTHKYITTAQRENKFGVDSATAKNIFLNRRRFSNLNIVGIHIHIGSQIVESSAFVKAIKVGLCLIEELKAKGIRLKYFDIGGGLGIIYKNERPQTALEFANAVLPLLEKSGLKIILEPGRFIVGNAGILVTRVTYIKETAHKKFVIVDAGMNDLIRPALYSAYHEIVPLQKSEVRSQKSEKVDVVGPVCESGDFFAKDRMMPPLKEGDLLAIMGTGAYGFSMSSNYNARPRPAEVMVMGSKFYLTRKPEFYADLVRGQIVPARLK